MTQLTNVIELSHSFEAADLTAENKPSLIARINSRPALAVFAGIIISLVTFAVMFSAGIFCQKIIYASFPMNFMPVEPIAALVTAFSSLVMVLTMKAGLNDDVLQALAWGAVGAFVLGGLAALIGFQI